MRCPLVISVGDPAGVGPEVALRAVAGRLADDAHVLVGDAARLKRAWSTVTDRPSEIAMRDAGGVSAMAPGEVVVVDVGPVSDECVAAHAPTVEGGRWQLRALEVAADIVACGAGRALVTGPVSKAAISSTGATFTGQTEFLAERAGQPRDSVTMLFLGPRLNVGLVTTHLAVADVPGAISFDRVGRSIRHLATATRRLVPGDDEFVVCVTGLNPHAGEGGLLGREEQRVIAPAIEALRGSHELAELGVSLIGPTPAETAFRWAVSGEARAVVAMYHDQATIASKLLDFGDAVNVTWGLPFVRTSVDHGVAYDAAAQGAASASGMAAALSMAERLVPGAEDG